MNTPPVVSDLSRGAALSDRHLEQLRRFAWLLDSQFRVPGTNFRFGVDAVVGLIPGIGDFAGAIASTVFLAQAIRMGAPGPVLARMVTNILTETLVGAIPGLGDLFDATFKANRRNMRLLERLTEAPEVTRQTSKRYLIGIAFVIAVILLVIGILAVVIGVMVFRAISEGRGPLG